MFWKLLRKLRLPHRSQMKHKQKRRHNCLPIRLRLEILEDRIVPSSMAGQADNGPSNSEIGVILQTLPILQGDIAAIEQDIATSSFGNLSNDINVFFTDLSEVFEGQVPTHAAPVNNTSTQPSSTPSPTPAPTSIQLGAYKECLVEIERQGEILTVVRHGYHCRELG